ncbi:NADPH-dependent F420 reductase [Nesterenkonia sp. DZ6]|uniref:NADPH-dependent F420 reductase n=1 Tax=Nesterenkonia sp. DZ6 TaxID=2901229 RepID=UPI001F4C80F3|nr:NAD(P)-binding domain-containing protein [Nesterenkonia sp. DZ6]MCH8560324.1 NAD(P)-binding domain-containing protein [Nesterenkonia sp. DZ6]
MKIGILGAGFIGSTLARKLSEAGHEVKVANSRGPETISPDTTATGAVAVDAAEVVTDVEVLITSIPFNKMPGIVSLIEQLPAEAVILDTSNYYPMRDGSISVLDEGLVESVWVTQQLRRPVAKAWNAILADSFATKGRPSGDLDRVAIPVAADREQDRAIAIQLVEETGFDAVDAGSLAESWRQQPAAPGYCTDLTREELPAALQAAEKDRIPKRRDLAMTVIKERAEAEGTVSGNYLLRLNRAIYS